MNRLALIVLSLVMLFGSLWVMWLLNRLAAAEEEQTKAFLALRQEQQDRRAEAEQEAGR